MYRSRGLSRYCVLGACNTVLKKTIFIRSLDKPNTCSKFKNFPQQPYTKFFVLDFEATCDNGMYLLKPQVNLSVTYLYVDIFRLNKTRNIFNATEIKNRIKFVQKRCRYK